MLLTRRYIINMTLSRSISLLMCDFRMQFSSRMYLPNVIAKRP